MRALAQPLREAGRAFGRLLKQLRRRGLGLSANLSWTQESLAHEIGASKDSVSNWERGETVPNDAKFRRLLAVSRYEHAVGAEKSLLDALIVARRQFQDEQAISNDADKALDYLPPLPIGHVQRTDLLARVSANLKASFGSTQASKTCVITSLVGMPGVGKTTMAIALARDLAEELPGRRFYVNLNGFSATEAMLAPYGALEILLRQAGFMNAEIPVDGTARMNAWHQVLRTTRGIAILDNARNTQQVTPLLVEDPLCLLIVTSRNRMPELLGAERVDLPPLLPEQAADLFQSFFDFRAISEAEKSSLAMCVEKCGYLPFTIRIVGSMWSRRATSFAAVAKWLSETAGSGWPFRTSDSDAATLLDSSFKLLGPMARRALIQIGVLPGARVTTDRFLATTSHAAINLQHLFELQDYCLIDSAGPDLWAAHDLIKSYAFNKSGGRDGASYEAYLAKSLKYYVNRLDKPTPLLKDGAVHGFVEAEIDCIIASCELSQRLETALVRRLCGMAIPICNQLGLHAQALILCDIGRADLTNGTLQEALLLHKLLADTKMDVGDFVDADKWYRVALQQAIALGQSHTRDEIIASIGFCDERRGRYEQGLAILSDMSPDATKDNIARARTVRGAIYWRMGRYEQALDNFIPPERRGQSDRELLSVELNHNNIGFTFFKLKEYNRARQFLLHSYNMAKKYNNNNAMLVSMVNLGYCYAVSRPRVGVDIAERAVRLAKAAGNRFQYGRALDALGDAHRTLGDYPAALSDWAEAELIFGACGAPEVVEVSTKSEEIRALWRKN